MWTPAKGTADLVERLGARLACDYLERILVGKIPNSELTGLPFAEVLTCIGGGHAARLLEDVSGTRLAYWPRVWAARSLAYLGDDSTAPDLVEALADPHWRVRMTAAQTLGRLGAEGYEERLGRLLNDEHDRVREALATALGRSGNEFAIEYLVILLEDEADKVRQRADRALVRIEGRFRNVAGTQIRRF